METNKIIKGDALQVLKTLPSESINCIMTSPPYWALRDYGSEVKGVWDGDEGCNHDWKEEITSQSNMSGGKGHLQDGNVGSFAVDYHQRETKSGFCNKCGAWKGQLGLEPTFDLYIKHLCDIFDEAKRVLRKDGTCWINIGDTYCGGHAGGSTHPKGSSVVNSGGVPQQTKEGRPAGNLGNTYTEKCLISIPARFQIEMINRGWILRNTIIWHKPNCMPSSVKDRFTVDFEYLFFFVKNKKYWFETQREPHKNESIERTKHSWDGHREPMSAYVGMDMSKMCHPEGRNKRAVWQICPQPFPESHFAVYPEELCETPLKAGCPKYVCKKCGKAREKVYERKNKDYKKREDCATEQYSKSHHNDKVQFIEKGLTDCGCNVGFEGGIVLDTFFGAGTTGLVALKQSKKFIGIELNQEYIDIAMKRLKPWIGQRKLKW